VLAMARELLKRSSAWWGYSNAALEVYDRRPELREPMGEKPYLSDEMGGASA